jgi:hypothetical protein
MLIWAFLLVLACGTRARNFSALISHTLQTNLISYFVEKLRFVNTEISSFWEVMISSMVERCQGFGGIRCFHFQSRALPHWRMSRQFSPKSWYLSIKFYGATPLKRARGSVVGWGTMRQAGRSRVQIPMRSLNFQPHYGPWVDSITNRNDYQESSWG